MFIIHKNRNKISMQPILKSKTTSFMFNKKNCKMGKKCIHRGGMGEPSKLLHGSVISVFTWISKYIAWLSKQ